MTNITYSGSIVFDTIAVAGVYDITADGAQGGEGAIGGMSPGAGGLGAAVGGDIYLSAGTVLEIVAGGAGAGGFSGGGGGGGSFVFETLSGTLTPIAIAGGGGGGYNGSSGAGGGGRATETGGGGGGASPGAGGTNPQPGSGGYKGGGGGGYTGGSGAGSVGTGGAGSSGSTFNGGSGVNQGTGGFGGGGGGGAEGGGGGGGYDGGGGGYFNFTSAFGGGGGGGSYLKPELTHTFAMSGTVSGNGEVSLVPLSQTFVATGSIQYETIVVSGTYDISADGAQGGEGSIGGTPEAGGLGAAVGGDIYLSAGTVLEIVAGGAGAGGFSGGGGGGGSFVFETLSGTLTPIAIAGGGGGGYFGPSGAGGGGRTAPTGGNGSTGGGGSSGRGGSHGQPGSGGDQGGGGGGYTGGSGAGYGGAGGAGSIGNAFLGGSGVNQGTGGFGGGGGGGGAGGGGGGGYGGGGGGGAGGGYGGGGGGLYLNPDLTDTFAIAGTVSGDGEIIVAEVLCYLHGTRILTPTGQMPVEDLQIGDAVVTRFGAIQRVKWLGRQCYAPRFISNNKEKWPVCIHAGALAAGVPARDLYVSPGHSMLLGDVLVLASQLVNGVTVTQTRPDTEQQYVQIDLGRHDCVIAEGAWSETYADAPGMRAQFHNAMEFYTLYPDEAPPDELQLCAPRPQEGHKLAAALGPVAARAAAGQIPGRLEGWVDTASDWKITGWARDSAHPQLPVLLEVLADGVVIGTALACLPRADLQQAGKANCGFSFMPRWRRRTQVLCLRRAADGAMLPAPDAEWNRKQLCS